ncbi:MAG: AI-2E family transporter, partial [Calditrichota bacterium]
GTESRPTEDTIRARSPAPPKILFGHGVPPHRRYYSGTEFRPTEDTILASNKPMNNKPKPAAEETNPPPAENRKPAPFPPQIPHWSLLTAALILLAAIVYKGLNQLSPLILSAAILMLLYPARRIRELRPFIILIIGIFICAVWRKLGSILTPFIISFIIAYALDPLLEWLVKKGWPRLVVIFSIVGIVLGSVVGIGFLIAPKLVKEIGDLTATLPRWIEDLKTWGVTAFIPWFKDLELPLPGLWSELENRIPDLVNAVISKFTTWSSSALTGMTTLLSGLANIVLIPILTIYFLNEFNLIKRTVYNLIPSEHQTFAQAAAQRLNDVLAAYFRGQFLVMLFLSVWIGLGLWLIAGVPYALLLGLAAGLGNLLPYIGTTLAALLTIIISLLQPDPWVTAIKAFAVFASAQFLEGNLLTPRIVGDRVGLHPLIVILVVFVFAAFFGFIGMLAAIPISASIKVIIQTWIDKKGQ